LQKAKGIANLGTESLIEIESDARKSAFQSFGFRVQTANGYSSPYSGDHFMAVPFSEVPKTGEIVYPEPFKLLD
jgi:hypothetical protein